MFEIKVLNAAALRVIDRAPATIAREFDKLLEGGGRTLRDAVRENIRTQGKTFRDPWPGPGKWIRAKKGVRKALSGVEREVQYVKSGRGTVGVYGPKYLDWHHKGFKVPADGRWYGIDLKQPWHLTRKPDTQAIRTGRYRWGHIKFRWGRDSVVPRRRIWPDAPMTHRFLTPVTNTWARNLPKALKEA
jgi:hypothetical protein